MNIGITNLISKCSFSSLSLAFSAAFQSMGTLSQVSRTTNFLFVSNFYLWIFLSVPFVLEMSFLDFLLVSFQMDGRFEWSLCLSILMTYPNHFNSLTFYCFHETTFNQINRYQSVRFINHKNNIKVEIPLKSKNSLLRPNSLIRLILFLIQDLQSEPM